MLFLTSLRAIRQSAPFRNPAYAVCKFRTYLTVTITRNQTLTLTIILCVHICKSRSAISTRELTGAEVVWADVESSLTARSIALACTAHDARITARGTFYNSHNQDGLYVNAMSHVRFIFHLRRSQLSIITTSLCLQQHYDIIMIMTFIYSFINLLVIK